MTRIKKRAVYPLIALSLSLVGTGFFVFLYFYPYHPVDFKRYRDLPEGLPSEGSEHSTLKSLMILNRADLSEFSAQVEAIYVDDAEGMTNLKKAVNIAALDYDETYFVKRAVLAISFKGLIMSNSKISKVTASASGFHLEASVENDFILDKSAHADDDIYTCFLISLSSKSIEATSSGLRLTIKKV